MPSVCELMLHYRPSSVFLSCKDRLYMITEHLHGNESSSKVVYDTKNHSKIEYCKVLT